MPRRNRNSGRELVNRDCLIDEAIHLARELTGRDPAWVTGESPSPFVLSPGGSDY